ncbi:MAG: tetratricopeptide repeat protein [Actinomycetota bacterium]
MKASFFATAACLTLSIYAAAAERATTVRKAELVSSPAANAQSVQTVERGADLTILQQQNSGNEPWVRVAIAIPGAAQNAPARQVEGWLPARPVVSAGTANGDEIVYGEAVDSEHQAEQRGGRKGAAQDALRLYYEVAQLFPNSPFAGEALWRSADIRRQLARAEGKPLQDQYLNEVISRFPHTKWADLAAFDLLDSQLCHDWNGLPDCPSKEAEAYERYAREHPQSPKFGEAIFDAAFRLASVADMYRISGDKDKSSAAHNKALALAQELAGNAVQGEWSYRATNLIYKLQQNIPLYGAPE